MSSINDDKIILGQINGIYGVQGWVKVFSHTDPRQNILNYSPWLIKINRVWRSFDVKDGRTQQGGKLVVAQIEGIADREQARTFMGCEIAILPEQLPEVTEGYYWMQLLDCDVFLPDGTLLGQVTELVETGVHDVLRVEKTAELGKGSELIPFVMERFILNVDIETKTIQVDWTLEGEDDSL